MMYRDLHSFPLLAKAGGIIPMTEEIFKREVLENPKTQTIRIFAGADGCFTLYEDDNTTTDYLDGICAVTEMKLDWEGKRFTIAAAKGHTELIPEQRTWTLEVNGMTDTKIHVTAGDKEIQPESVSFDSLKNALTIVLPGISSSEEIVVTFEKAELAKNAVYERVYDFLNKTEMEFDVKSRINTVMSSKISTLAKVSDIFSQNLSEDITGALVELLTAME